MAPKRAALADANRKLENATRKLSTIRAKVKELNDSVAALEAHLMKVSAEQLLSQHTYPTHTLVHLQTRSKASHSFARHLKTQPRYELPLLRRRASTVRRLSCATSDAKGAVCTQATADKNAAVAQADKTSAKAALAQRLIANLAGENHRWTLGIGSFAAAEGLRE